MTRTKVAVMFSGGKDSIAAVHYALQQGWDIEALVAIKPRNTEAYLWHYPTVEWTLLQAESMSIPLILAKTEDIGSKTEANVLDNIFGRLKADTILLGGVGLQATQIKEVRKMAEKYGKSVVVPHANMTSEQLLEEEIKQGFDIRIIDVAADGLGQDWIGKRLDFETMIDLKHLSGKFGFDALGEGGQYNTFVVDGPIFKKKIEFLDVETVWDSKTSSGYLEVKNAELVAKDESI